MKTEDLLYALNDVKEEDIDAAKTGRRVKLTPKKIIALDTSALNAKGYHPAVITDQEKCIACAMCATMCPDCVIKVEKDV